VSFSFFFVFFFLGLVVVVVLESTYLFPATRNQEALNPKSHLQPVIQDLGWRVWDPMQGIFFGQGLPTLSSASEREKFPRSPFLATEIRSMKKRRRRIHL
jgi:hypothetical protein